MVGTFTFWPGSRVWRGEKVEGGRTQEDAHPMILRSEYALRLLVKGAAKPMKERLGGKPASNAKTWAARGQRRLQEIRNLRPKGKATS